MTLETDILRRIQRLSVGAVRLMRNNCGGLYDRTGAFVRYGLGVGTSDLIGFKTITITPEMVGQKVAVFTAIEVKSERGRVRPKQQQFIAVVRKAGGIAGIARSEDDAATLLSGSCYDTTEGEGPSTARNTIKRSAVGKVASVRD